MSTRIVVLGLVAGLLSVVQALSLPILDTEVNPANQHIYLLFDSSNWSDAEAAAVAQGGHLVTINDQAEQEWVWNLWGAQYQALWIGLSDAATEGTFVWSSGESSSFTWWGNTSDSDPNNDEPNDAVGGWSGSDFVHMWNVFPDEAGGWNDEVNRASIDGWTENMPDWNLYGVAEIVPQVHPVPEFSSTLLLLGLAVAVLRMAPRDEG